MDQAQIQAVAKILLEWNPLGGSAHTVTNLDGYRAEAIDIIMALRIQPKKIESVVKEVLNQAFDLSLEANDCIEPARKIIGILEKRN